eukprot:465425_1
MDPAPLLQNYEIELLQPASNVPENRCRSNQEILQLVEVIGGMNVILNHCLSSDNPYHLSSDQLTEINQILTSSQTPKTKTNLEPTILNLDVNDNFLYHLFGDSKVIKFFKSKCYIIPSIIIFLTVFFCGFVLRLPNLSYSIFLVSYIMILPALLITLLSINKTVMYQVVKLFTFWFKLFYCARYISCYFWYGRRLHAQNVSYTLWSVYTIVIFIYLFIDGIYVQSKRKYAWARYILIPFACWMVFMSTAYTIREFTVHDSARTVYICGIYQLDLVSWMANSSRVLTLFVMKQAVYFAWKPQHAVLLRDDIRINWISFPK